MANKNSAPGKRKNVFIDLKTEPALKALKKSEIINEYELLKEKYNELVKKTEILIDEKKKNIEAIVLLEETVQVMEQAQNKNKVNVEKIDILEHKLNSMQAELKSSETVSVQTEDMEMMFCIECEYPAEDIFDLGEHMYEVHAENNNEYEVSCHYCSQFFKTKSDVMLHNKRAHKEKVQPCRNFAQGHCDFTESECWFSHTKSSKIVKKDFNCNNCDESFHSHRDFMIHRKKQHMELVPKCREENNCNFGDTCWFMHIPYLNENENLNDSKQDISKNLQW